VTDYERARFSRWAGHWQGARQDGAITPIETLTSELCRALAQ
jgi:hypothetical protein